MSHDPGGLIDAVAKLPAFNGIGFRGLSAGASEPPALGVLTELRAASRDVRVATENFASPTLLVVLNLTARDLSWIAQHPQDAELALMPATAWRRLTEFETAGPVRKVIVLEELDLSGRSPAPTEWGATVAEVTDRAAHLVQQALTTPAVPVHVAGKFCGDWPAEVPAGWAAPHDR
ncbi:hypothetical protein [Cellulomonas soli]